jgi:hypothetical protein
MAIREIKMNEDIIARLNTHSQQLHVRSLALAHPGQDNDLSLMMQSLAITMEAVSALGATVNRLDGLQGLGRAGD